MQPETKKIIKLTIQEILLTLGDVGAVISMPRLPFYRREVYQYLRNRRLDRQDFLTKISYLRRKGYVRTLVEGKKKYIELTQRGKKKFEKMAMQTIKIKRPKKWDRKWRVVIFDIPKKIKQEREIFRQKLINLGFIRVQKSVYIHPFKCAAEIAAITSRLGISRYVLLMISDIIQTEKSIIADFLDNNILRRSDVRNSKKLRF